MIFFDDVLDIAESRIKAWAAYPSVKEVTLIRDAFGHAAVLISSTTSDRRSMEQSLEQLSADLQNTLGYYFSKRVYYREKSKQNDLEKEIIKNLFIIICSQILEILSMLFQAKLLVDIRV